jgi:hypothetical protein
MLRFYWLEVCRVNKTASQTLWNKNLQRTTGQAQNAEYSTSGELAEPLCAIPVLKTIYLKGGAKWITKKCGILSGLKVAVGGVNLIRAQWS